MIQQSEYFTLMKSIGSRVRDIRLEKGWTQNDLAKKSKKSMNYVNRFENDEFKNPTIDTIEQFAEALEVHPSQILFSQEKQLYYAGRVLEKHGIQRPLNATDAPTYIPEDIPVVGLAKAGNSGFFDDCGFPAREGFKKIHRPDFVKDPNAYALIVDGDSMNPRVRKGETVMVEPERHTPINGDLVVVRLKSGEVMLKEIYYQDGLVVLKSTNQNYDPIAIQKNEIDFCHKVVLIKPK